MLFSIVPQLFDVVAACIFISAELQVWIAVIVLITLGSYVPLTVILTEMRVKYRRCAASHQRQHPPQSLADYASSQPSADSITSL